MELCLDLVQFQTLANIAMQFARNLVNRQNNARCFGKAGVKLKFTNLHCIQEGLFTSLNNSLFWVTVSIGKAELAGRRIWTESEAFQWKWAFALHTAFRYN